MVLCSDQVDRGSTKKTKTKQKNKHKTKQKQNKNKNKNIQTKTGFKITKCEFKVTEQYGIWERVPRLDALREDKNRVNGII